MNVSGLSPAVQERLEALAVQFRDELPGRLDEIRTIAAGLDEARPGSETLAALKLHVHKLAGAAATFGHEVLTGRAKRIEHVLDAVLDDGDPVEEQAIDEIRALTTELTSSQVSEREPSVDGPSNEQPALHVVAVCDDSTMMTALSSLLSEVVTSFRRLERLEAAFPGSGVIVLVASSTIVLSDPGAVTRLAEHASGERGVHVLVLGSSADEQERLAVASIAGAQLLPPPVTAQQVAAAVELIYTTAVHTGVGILIAGLDSSRRTEVHEALSSADVTLLHASTVNELVNGLLSERVHLVVIAGSIEGAGHRQIVRLLESDRTTGEVAVVAFDSCGIDDMASVQRVINDGELVGTRLANELYDRAARVRENAGQRLADASTAILSAHAFARMYSVVVSQVVRNHRAATLALVRLLVPEQNDSVDSAQILAVARRATASLISERMRNSDLCGLVGQYEFALLLPDTDGNQARPVMESLAATIDEKLVSVGAGSAVSRVVIGVACHPAFDAPIPLRDAAGRALREAVAGTQSIVVLSE